MRYNDFKSVILEYKREPTARSFGDKIIGRLAASPSGSLDGDLYTGQTIVNLAMNPQNFSHWGIGLKKMQFGNTYISVGVENAKDALEQVKPHLINLVLSELEQSDPTPNNVFVPWLAREWSAGNIRRFEDIDSRLRPLMQDFIAYKNKKNFPPEAKDIMRLTAPKFEEVMTAYHPPENQARARGEAKTVLDNATARVIVPENEEAACYYGQGTKWCTAATRGNNMFNHYNNTGKMFIILPKQPKHDGEKYQLHFYSEQFMDENDDPVDLQWLLVQRFPELMEPFKELEPQIADYVSFTDDATLMALWELVGQAVQDAVQDNISDWEASDDYYHRWRSEEAEKRGYVTDDGDVDWDKVNDDDDLNSYTDFNDHAGQYERDFMAVQDANANQIKAFAHEVWENGDTEGTPSLSDLEELFAGMLEAESRQEMESLTQFLQSSVFIRRDFKKGPDGKIKNGSIIGEVGPWTVGVNWSRRGVNEGWKDWVAGGAMALGALGAHGDAGAATRQQAQPQGVGSAIKVAKNYQEPQQTKSIKPGKQAQKIQQVAQPKKMTPEQSRLGHTPEQLRTYIQACAERYIPPEEIARFMGEVAHETNNFKSMIEENPEKNIKHYGKRGNPLGNSGMDDAWKYIGRGYLQITGKYNYKHFGDKIRKGLGDELVANPDLALKPDVAAALAVVYWRERVAPKMQAGASSKEIAKAINGKKPKGLKSREARTKQAAASLNSRRV